jgi:hypothetical protein
MDRAKAANGLEGRLQGIPRIDRMSFTKTFVQEQQLYGKVYSAQGRTYFHNWEDNIDGQLQLSKGDGVLDIGVGTPILKARNPQVTATTGTRGKGFTHQAGTEDIASNGRPASPSSTTSHPPPKKSTRDSQGVKRKEEQRVPESTEPQQRKHKDAKKESGRHRLDSDEEHVGRMWDFVLADRPSN